VTATGRDNNGGDEEDIVSVLNENSSVQVSMEKRLSGLLEKMRELEEGMTNRRDIIGEGSIVSASTIIRPENEEFMKECLRKFVAKRIFPSWKCIFKKEKLGQVVSSALKHGYVAKPLQIDVAYMEERYGKTVRNCLDGCRANGQTGARKRYLSELLMQRGDFGDDM
jgi:hypothetical protein